MNVFVRPARTSVTTTIPTWSRIPRPPPLTYGSSTINGQCHRYTEYDTSPSHCTGRTPSTPVGEAPDCVPAQITAAVPSTGSNAVYPGNGV